MPGPPAPVTRPNSSPMSGGWPDAASARWVVMNSAARRSDAPSARTHTPRTRTRLPFCSASDRSSPSSSTVSPSANCHWKSRISARPAIPTAEPSRREQLPAATGWVSRRRSSAAATRDAGVARAIAPWSSRAPTVSVSSRKSRVWSSCAERARGSNTRTAAASSVVISSRSSGDIRRISSGSSPAGVRRHTWRRQYSWSISTMSGSVGGAGSCRRRTRELSPSRTASVQSCHVRAAVDARSGAIALSASGSSDRTNGERTAPAGMSRHRSRQVRSTTSRQKSSTACAPPLSTTTCGAAPHACDNHVRQRVVGTGVQRTLHAPPAQATDGATAPEVTNRRTACVTCR